MSASDTSGRDTSGRDDDGFLSRLALPVGWRALEGPPSAEECERAAWANAGVVAFLLHGVELDAAQRTSDERLAEALAPLRIKLDLVIEMLGRLAYRDVKLPPVRDIEFGVRRMGWRSTSVLRPGDWLRIELYFDPKFLDPVVVYGRVASAVPEDGGAYAVQAELANAPADAEEGFARLAFLAQRRQLAQRGGHAARSER